MSDYKNFFANLFLSVFVIGFAWIGFSFGSLFFVGSKATNAELISIKDSIKNQIVDIRGRSNAKETKVKRNIRGVSSDLLKDDTDLASDVFSKYLNVKNKSEFDKSKKLAIDHFTDGSDFVKIFFKGDSFEESIHFKSLTLYPREWSDDNSVVYDGLLKYERGSKSYVRLISLKVVSVENNGRELKDIQINESEFK